MGAELEVLEVLEEEVVLMIQQMDCRAVAPEGVLALKIYRVRQEALMIL
jgi:hypothetical protein